MTDADRQFLIPIRSGLTPVPDSERHRLILSRERAAELRRRLAELDEWRARSLIDSQNYYVRGAW